MSRINRLSEAVINRIAAGEVIERPAGVIRELVENALDADARHIVIDFCNGGRGLMRVEDDGCGMGEDDLALCVTRHATSKLNDETLTHILSLGFRGEALPSIGSVSRLRIISRLSGVDLGDAHEICVEGGCVSSVVPAALNLGTVVEVRDLFYAHPARLKFLKSVVAETSEAVHVVKRLALSAPQVSFDFRVDNRSRFSYSAFSLDLDGRLGRVRDVMGKDFATDSIAVESKDSIGGKEMSLSGFISVPTYHHQYSNKQFLFVNGRPVRDRLLLGCLRAVYGDLIPRGRHPVAVLFFDLPPQEVDVNVHPTKSEVRFRNSALVRHFIISSLKRSLVSAGIRTSSALGSSMLGKAVAEGGRADGRRGSSEVLFSDHNAMRSSSDGRIFDKIQTSGVLSIGREEGGVSAVHPSDFSQHLPIDMAPSVSSEVVSSSQQEDSRAFTDYPLGSVCGQFHDNYIIAERPDGIIIIDQHAAHERLVYERLKAQFYDSSIARQVLLLPEVIELTDEDSGALFSRYSDSLMRFGLVVEGFGSGSIVVREVPALLSGGDIKSLIHDLADALRESDSMGGDGENSDGSDIFPLKDRLDRILATMACYGSIRSGRRLRVEEMHALLRDMESTPNSGQCNHGRPSWIALKLSDIERLFGR